MIVARHLRIRRARFPRIAPLAAGLLAITADAAANVQLSSITAAQGNNGNLQVIGIGAEDGLAYLASWQSSSDGAWHAGFRLP